MLWHSYTKSTEALIDTESKNLGVDLYRLLIALSDIKNENDAMALNTYLMFVHIIVIRLPVELK